MDAGTQRDWPDGAARHARNEGVARALLGAMVTAAVEEGRTTLLVWVPSGTAAAVGAVAIDWAQRIGMALASTDRCSRVRVEDIDRTRMMAWNEGPQQNLGYRLVHYLDRCPTEYRRALVDANDAMRDAPVDDLDYTIPGLTAADLDTREDRCAAKNLTTVGTLALAADGSAAGYSAIYVSRHRPQIAHQGDTGVVAAHRGHGIGRWLKAANFAWAERCVPGFEVIETYNAESNPWMLAINDAMGFTPHVGYSCFQGDVGMVAGAVAAQAG